ncbi:membrane bound O-acyl transferase, MBOAT family protein [Oleiphilus messinensis]|uniref:Probable alginate O-acetylase n=1 Tax=Oleiphilus messinensis TaxID=141451 RepID=A0A1Y0IE79_9GAMM|nr:MBOAT family protein [Oleiphilus messinensis]ARU58479.1 membrane bound O-acyl transferase, MBOAT family protein [Oleiphilus messinensis]
MVFSSNVFLFLFLPAFLTIYYLTPNRAKNLIILLASYAFYAWWRVDFLLLFVAVTLWNYLIGILIFRNLDSEKAKTWLIVGVVGNLSTLGYFKYANFGVDSFNYVVSTLGFEPFSFASVILPIGISFYIFQAISYIIDVYRKDTPPTTHVIDFAAFIALFPQLIAGPVLRYKDLANQFTDRIHSFETFSKGAIRFMQGFISKVFIADSIAPIVDACYATANPTTGDAWLGAFAYTAQLFFDFAGYSAMAIGLGLMMGFRFIENFNNPYISQSITEFWRRWHISLSSWLRDYLYISMGGNRHGTVKTYRNLFMTMFLGGLWHGANWTFVIWGCWHGIILCIERALGVKTDITHFNIMRWGLTFLLVMLGWVIFRAPDVATAFGFYNAMFNYAMFNISSWSLSDRIAESITSMQVTLLVVSYLVVFVMGFRARIERWAQKNIRFIVNFSQALTIPLFVLSMLKLSAQSFSPFLYFQF